MMKSDNKLTQMIDAGEFIVTAEFLPRASTDGSLAAAAAGSFKESVSAVNVADNPHGPVLSSLAGSLALRGAGIEPIFQMVTRDRNRIAHQSDLLGAVSLGIKNVLCLSGYHQALTGCPESANVYDIDSIQLIAAIQRMTGEGVLMDGTKIEGPFPVLPGAVANPDLRPMELNIIRVAKKVKAGAGFIQTQAVFDTDGFGQWLEAVREKGLSEKTAILAGVYPLESADEATRLSEKYTEMVIPDSVIERMGKAGDEAAQKKEGLAVCIETIKKIKAMDGVRGIHILSGGREQRVPEIIAASGL
jgi:methylenetetrahydrofolate reductase (NADPH)